jgi:hypothetical protein
MRWILLTILAAAAAPHTAATQELRPFIVEMDRKMLDLERRIEVLEQERRARIAIEEMKERQRQADAKRELMLQCIRFRNNPENLRQLKECREKGREAVRYPCLTLELEAC